MSITRPRALLASLAFAVAGLAAPNLVADTATKIAVVDTQRAVMESEEGMRMRATLKKLFDERQQKLDERQNDLQKEREELEKQRGVLSQQQLAQRAEKWQMEVAQVQQMFVEYNQELQKKQNELMQPILASALDVVQKIATDGGFAMVIDKQAVPYVRADLDLTDRVIAAHNGGGKPAAAAPTPAKAGAPKTAKTP